MTHEIINGEAIAEMSKLAERGIKVDACITDPPYGTTPCAWDAVIPFAPMWANLRQLVKRDGAIVLFGSQPFTSALVMSNPQMFRQSLVWEKTRPVNVLNADKMFMKYHEDLLVFYDQLPTFNPQMLDAPRRIKVQRLQDRSGGHLGKTGERDGHVHDNGGLRHPSPILKFSNVCRPHLHPTQKPEDLLRYLVRTYTNPGDTVLDFTAGSFTTGVACAIEGRNFIGIEQSEDYCRIGEARIQRAKGIPADIPRLNVRRIETPLFDNAEAVA